MTENNLPYPYLDPAHYPTVDPEIIRAIQADLDELNRRLARVTPPSGTASAHVIQDEGVSLTQRTTLNFVGAGVTAADAGGKTVVTVPGGTGYATVQDESSALTQRTVIDFQGAGVSAADSGGKTVVTIQRPASIGAMWAPPAGAIAENVPRPSITSASIAINNGVLTLIGGLTLESGRTYSSATFLSGNAAHTSMTHNWACLVRVSDREILAVSADNATTWAANTLRTFTFGTPYVPSVDEAVWVGLVVVSSSFGTLTGSAVTVGTALTPYWNGESNGSLTTPLSVATIVNAPTDSLRGPYWTYVS